MPNSDVRTIGGKEIFIYELGADCLPIVGGRGFRTCNVVEVQPFNPEYKDPENLTGMNFGSLQCGPTIKTPTYIESMTGMVKFCSECPELMGFLQNTSVAGFTATPTDIVGVTWDIGGQSCTSPNASEPTKVAIVVVEEYASMDQGVCVPVTTGARITLIGLATNFRLASGKVLNGQEAFEPEYEFDILTNPQFATLTNTPDEVLVGLTAGAWGSGTAVFEGDITVTAYEALDARTSGCEGFVI